MQQSARINAVLELSDKIGSSRIPMDGTVGDYMRHRRYIGSKDRADIVERLYSMTRAYARITWHLDQVTKNELTPRLYMIAWLVLGENKSAERVQELFNGTQYSPDPLTDDEITVLNALIGRTLNDAAQPDDVRSETPPAYAESLRAYFGADFEKEMAAMVSGATLDLRVNVKMIERDNVLSSLGKDRIKTEPTPYSPWGLRVEDKVYISQTKAFVKGWIDIQDEGSQLIAYICNAQPGMQVLDYCAGAGGKTLALANAMRVKGRIVAMDTEAARLEKGRQRFRRAHVSDIIEVRPLSDEKNRKWLRRQKESFDVVLADVPCSGTGTWRRNPDTRWRVYGPGLAELLTVQADILDRVAKTVKGGGRLVYATCSLLPEENEKQIEAFLARNPDFAVMPLAQAWPDGNPPGDGPYMRLTPLRHNTDGFFAAVLTRTTSAGPLFEATDEE